ncbi:MAG TPA: HTTM domain-containing protein [Dehalococcoidia bacterium]|nr:HTTM domain-containing protein [Dehalococcoidia bacterium]
MTATRAARTRDALDRLFERLLSPVDIASLVFFRVFFGVLAFWHVWQLMRSVKTEYITPDFHFTYYGLGWIQPLPGELMNVVFLLMAASAIFIALGLFYRAAAVTFFVLHTYAFLIDISNYWNHYYLISLLAFLMIFVPAHRAYSLDVARGAVLHADEAPAWGLWILRGQMAIVYFFAGVAKATSSDWWHGRPMDAFLASYPEFPLVGRWFDEQWLIYLASYGGMLFDLFILPLLLWPKTRVPALAVAIGFHVTNSLIFDIEVFPWLAIAATLLFLPPSWPRFGGQWSRLTPESAPAKHSPPPAARRPRNARGRFREGGGRFYFGQRTVAGILGVFFLFQVLIPLRQFAYPGNPAWTTEGYFFSWRMLIADRKGSAIAFFLESKTEEATCIVNTRSYLYSFQTPWLLSPDAVVQFAHHLAAEYTKRGADVEVHAWTDVGLNGRSARSWIDPEVDLASVSRTLGHHGWLTDIDDATHIELPVAQPCPDPPPLERVAPAQQRPTLD